MLSQRHITAARMAKIRAAVMFFGERQHLVDGAAGADTDSLRLKGRTVFCSGRSPVTGYGWHVG